jgi:subtilisin-like proprotein convertase family protein
MIKQITLLTFCLLGLAGLSAQNMNWSILPNSEQTTLKNHNSVLQSWIYEFDLDKLNALTISAPIEFDPTPDQQTIIDLPTPHGKTERFAIQRSPVMMPGLAARYPEINTYKGVSLEHPGRTTRFAVTPRGLDGVISGNGPEISLEIADQPNRVLVYDTKDITADAIETAPLACGVGMEETVQYLKESHQGQKLDSRSPSQPQQLRTYRTAIAVTGEWTRASGGTVQSALSRLNSAVNRINQVLESDVAIRLILVDSLEKVIFTDPNTDPYAIANEGRALLQVNTEVLNQRLGPNSYDFGHVFTNGCTDVGGVASLASVCTSRKGAAVTCWYTSNLEFVTIRIAAHEMGHQMSALHTFNNCNGNESGGNAFEPGSGSTIMSYFGLCGSNNVSGGFVPHYHVSSLQQIIQFMHNGGGNSCATRIPTENIKPTVHIDLEDGFNIPIKTPFILDSEGLDDNGDELMYTWEEFDIGPGQRPPCQPIDDSPLFKSVAPRSASHRIFPDWNLIYSNSIDCYELLPEATRNMRFRVTVRDQNEAAGAVAWDQINFRATAAAGPFLVEWPNSFKDTLRGGKYNLITWDVANTNNAPVNCENVDILLVRGSNFNAAEVLISNTPNDGSEYILIPNRNENNVRVMVRASDNIFFDISDESVRVEPTTQPTYSAALSGNSAFVCLPDQIEESIQTLAILDYNAPLTLSYGGEIPDGLEVIFDLDTILPGGSTNMTIDLDNVRESGIFELEIYVTDTAGNVLVMPYTIDMVRNEFNNFRLLTPEAGITGVTELPLFTWDLDQDAETYRIQIATNPSFAPQYIVFEKANIVGGSYTPNDLLKLNTIYYWRVLPSNRCEDGPSSPTRAFSTRALVCQTFEDNPDLNLPRGASSQQLVFEVSSSTTIVDVNVIGVKGRYDNVRSLTLELISPAGTRVTLLDDYPCNSPFLNLGFDDEAPNIKPCPPNNRQSIKPVDSLAAFIGEGAQGAWKLNIKTSASGNGGILETWALEVCTNSSQSGPFYVTKDTLRTKPGITATLGQSVLEVRDPDNPPAEVYFVVVEEPKHGKLQLVGDDIPVGGAFNQSAINGWVVEYVHTGPDSISMDYFLYTVTDNEGGWLGIDTFHISISEDNVVAVDQATPAPGFDFFPNPAQQQLTVVLDANEQDRMQLRLVDLRGATIREWRELFPGKQTLFLPSLHAGMYFLELRSQRGVVTKKLQIQP